MPGIQSALYLDHESYWAWHDLRIGLEQVYHRPVGIWGPFGGTWNTSCISSRGEHGEKSPGSGVDDRPPIRHWH